MKKLSFFGLAALILTAMVLPASGSPLTVTGTFSNDNDVVLIPFTIPETVLVTFQTFGYGGGTNGAGQFILPGGFEPLLQLFDATTGVFRSGVLAADPPPPACAPRKPDPNRLNFCFDVYAQLLLAPGDYVLALTQNPNSSAGTNLSDGFIFDGIPEFEPGKKFVGITGLQGDSHYALDITPSPEPGAALLIAPALLLIVLKRRLSS